MDGDVLGFELGEDENEGDVLGCELGMIGGNVIGVELDNTMGIKMGCELGDVDGGVLILHSWV